MIFTNSNRPYLTTYDHLLNMIHSAVPKIGRSGTTPGTYTHSDPTAVIFGLPRPLVH